MSRQPSILPATSSCGCSGSQASVTLSSAGSGEYQYDVGGGFIPEPVQRAPGDTDTQLGQTETEMEGPGESSAGRAFAVSRAPELAPQSQIS